MIDLRKLRELIRLMVTNDLSEMDLRDSEQQVTIRRHDQHAPPVVQLQPTAPPPPQAAVSPTTEFPTSPVIETGQQSIDSPMVGTFYAAATPEATPFVSEGDHVDTDTVVCLIEAMKIFNEIKPDVPGTITQVFVQNGDPVEFGQPLFAIRPE